jgi:glutaredoxin
MSFAPRAGILIAAAAVAWCGLGCRRSIPDAPVAASPLADHQALHVLKDGRFLFTYPEQAGTFATTDKPEIIPEVARKLVRVIDPGQTKAAESTDVHVVDIDDLLKTGKTTARTMSREAFETAAMAQLPPGESSPFAPGRPQATAAATSPNGSALGPSAGTASGRVMSPPGTPVVTVYGTSWCGACRAARQYFADHKIPFADKDIEQDPAAARELAEKAAKMGIPTDRVPVLEVRGRLLLGFDRARVEALLGEPT